MQRARVKQANARCSRSSPDMSWLIGMVSTFTTHDSDLSWPVALSPRQSSDTISSARIPNRYRQVIWSQDDRMHNVVETRNAISTWGGAESQCDLDLLPTRMIVSRIYDNSVASTHSHSQYFVQWITYHRIQGGTGSKRVFLQRGTMNKTLRPQVVADHPSLTTTHN